MFLFEEEPPQILASLVILENMQFKAYLKTEVINSSHYCHIFPGEIIDNFSQLKHWMAKIKCSTECLEPLAILEKAKRCLEEYSLVQRPSCKMTNFVIEQLDLLMQSKSARRYSPALLISNYLLYAVSPNGYRELRQQQLFILSSEQTLREVSKNIGRPKCSQLDYLQLRVSKLNSYE